MGINTVGVADVPDITKRKLDSCATQVVHVSCQE
jgi:hypothetical protein